MTHAVFDAARTFDLYQQHKSLGFLALALTALRLAARLRYPAPEPVSGWEGRLARAVQASVLRADAFGDRRGLARRLDLAAADPDPLASVSSSFQTSPRPTPLCSPRATLAHRLAAYAIAALVALHVAGALKHEFVDGDGTLKRMAPRLRR